MAARCGCSFGSVHNDAAHSCRGHGHEAIAHGRKRLRDALYRAGVRDEAMASLLIGGLGGAEQREVLGADVDHAQRELCRHTPVCRQPLHA
eukprot:CAMPEP_0183347772 /NCGR_PEP_ID=MMETSP0164_2-20130417/12490_1 /TAXON_ID=221442 /ORGANISM="Coccolithus pelagicus ssp braarudi, Strain PLY182g" /LENGTH=90 /DNA_ID=CAMNT_0025519257 /DNA_START=263 /DNA_END=531 /DNA_ORIENTATION=-